MQNVNDWQFVATVTWNCIISDFHPSITLLFYIYWRITWRSEGGIQKKQNFHAVRKRTIPKGEVSNVPKGPELVPTASDFRQHCKWLMKPTTLRLLVPQSSQLSHFLVWWILVRIRINNFSSLISCNKSHIILQVPFSIFITLFLPLAVAGASAGTKMLHILSKYVTELFSIWEW